MKEILQYLNQHGEQFDTDIAKATGIAIPALHRHLAELTAKGAIMSCHTIRFEGKKKIEGISCRIAGFIPKAAPGRKSKVQLKLS
jgi:DNA-binding transcriptional ArsR family regulator